jgi:arylsulfatase A-like enzyme
MFGKHGRFMRGGPLRGTFYDDVLRIPLLIRHPALAPRRVDGLAQLIDLGPTLLEMLGCEVPAVFRGKSLRPLLLRRTAVNERVFAGAAFTPSGRNPFFKYHSTIYGVRDLEWKLMLEKLFYSVGPEEHIELYNVRDDPQELIDVSSKNPERVAALKRALSGWLEEIKADAFKL